jgi:hypothetical protein
VIETGVVDPPPKGWICHLPSKDQIGFDGRTIAAGRSATIPYSRK